MASYQIGAKWFEAPSRYLTLELRDSSDIRHDGPALRQRIAEDGYLLVRGLHEPNAVLQARRDILEGLAADGRLDLSAPLDEGVAHPSQIGKGTATVRGQAHLKKESLRRVVCGEPVKAFFDRFLGGDSTSYNFQWLRAVGPGAGSTIHYDVVYMGRGTRNLFTCWTPFGRVTPEMGPLVICLGSHRWQNVIDTYGSTDVDRDLTCGYFTDDPEELVDRFGGQWATTTFEPGDAMILPLFTMHGSLVNNSNRFRISCDTRYQLASEPMDDRWKGANPQGHDRFWAPDSTLEPVAVSRKKWGI